MIDWKLDCEAARRKFGYTKNLFKRSKTHYRNLNPG